MTKILNVKSTTKKNPWGKPLEEIEILAQETNGLLLSGPVGSELHTCAQLVAKRLKTSIRYIDCTNNTDLLIHQLKVGFDDEYDGHITFNRIFEIKGVFALVDIQLCNFQIKRFFAELIINGKAVLKGYTFKLGEEAKILGLISALNEELIDASVRQVFNNNSIWVSRITQNPDEIPSYLVWYINQLDESIVTTEFENETIGLFVEYDWLGDRQELRELSVRIFNLLSRMQVITPEICRPFLINNTRYIEYYRQDQIFKLLEEITFRGHKLSFDTANRWVSQFVAVADDVSQMPWEIGYRILQEITTNYYFSDNDKWDYLFKACNLLKKQRGEVDTFVIVSTDSPMKSGPSASRKANFSLQEQFSTLHSKGVDIPGLELVLMSENPPDIVVCADDFIGTGTQIIENYIHPIQTLLAKLKKNTELVFLIAIGYKDGLDAIQNYSSDDLIISSYCGHILFDEDKAFTAQSSIFPEEHLRSNALQLVKEIIGKRLFSPCPVGFGDLESLVVFSDNVPDNTLPAITTEGMVRNYHWNALFPRLITT